MLKLADKIKQRQEGQFQNETDASQSNSVRQSRTRDKLLVFEINELNNSLPKISSFHLYNPDKLSDFEVTIKPDEGPWRGGKFRFRITVPEEYNSCPPKVECLTKIWHPNIDENGDICLSILRQHALDSSGWLPTRRLRDVVWGLCSLFFDLCDFNDPLNTAAAEQYKSDKRAFEEKVRNYIRDYAR